MDGSNSRAAMTGATTVLAVDGCDRDRLVVVLLSGGTVAAARRVNRTEAELDIALPRALAELAGRSDVRLEAVVVADGPGSYTGVRASMAGALGVAAALRVPLFTTGALEVVACGAPPDTSRVMAMAPAGRGGLYVGLFERGAGGVSAVGEPQRVDAATAVVPDGAVAVCLDRVPEGWPHPRPHIGDAVAALAAAALAALRRSPADPAALRAVTLSFPAGSRGGRRVS